MANNEEKKEFEHHVDTSEIHSYMPALIGLASGAFVAAGVIFMLKGFSLQLGAGLVGLFVLLIFI